LGIGKAYSILLAPNPTFRVGPRSVDYYNKAFHASILADILKPYGIYAYGVSFKKVSSAEQEKQKIRNFIRDYVANNEEDYLSVLHQNHYVISGRQLNVLTRFFILRPLN
jgi:hypothetical protein